MGSGGRQNAKEISRAGMKQSGDGRCKSYEPYRSYSCKGHGQAPQAKKMRKRKGWADTKK